MAKQLIIFNRKSQTVADIHGRNQLDQDTTRYFPWVSYAVGELGWQWWAVHLLEKWGQLPRYLAAPSEYDETYYQLKGKRRTAWLAALRRVCNGVYKGAVLAEFDEEDDYYPLSINLREDYGGLKGDLASAIMRGLDKLEEWLSWREQSEATQLLTTLSVVHLAAREGAITLPLDVQPTADKRFKALLEELQQALVVKPVESSLRALHSQLMALSELAYPAVPVSVGELSSIFPSLQWPKLPELLALPVSTGFWLDLKAALTTRGEWANKAVVIVGNALGLLALPAPSSIEPQIALTLKQGAMLYYYTKQPITDNNRSKLASELGYTGKTSGISLVKKYAEWRGLLDSELPDSKRQLGHLKKDLAKVLPYLNDKAANEVIRLLKRIAKKIKGGCSPPLFVGVRSFASSTKTTDISCKTHSKV